ncbi:hypothetical protein GC170_13185 [bacterium]|nr:hypothetical protein [bacterium]
MASHDDARGVTHRTRRKFQPIVEPTLERREVMTATPLPVDGVPDVAPMIATDAASTATPVSTTDAPVTTSSEVTTTSVEPPVATTSGDIATTSVGGVTPVTNEMVTTGAVKRGLTRPGSAGVDWSSMAGWSWLSGSWKSNTKIDFMQTLARTMGAKNVRFPSIPSMDTWIVGTDSYVGRTALAAQQQAMPLDGLVIKPGGSGAPTTLSMTSADGTPPVELPLTSVKGNSATFTGSTPIFETTTTSDGKEVTTTTQGAPVRVNLTRRNASSMRITSEMLTGGKWIRMFTYTATKMRNGNA